MKTRPVTPPSRRHRPEVYGANRARVAVKAWSYPHGRGREIYIDVIEAGRHVATVRVVARGNAMESDE